MHNARGTLIPCHSQLGMGGISSVDATSQQTQVQGTVPDLVVLKKVPCNRHSDGSNPALN